MRIGIETECLNSPTVTGTEFAAISLIQGLHEKGHEVICYHTNNAQHPTFDQAIKHHIFRKRQSTLIARNLAPLFHYSCFKELDILHFSAPKVLYLKRPPVPFALTIHDVTPLLFPALYPKRAHWIFKYILPKYLKEASAIIVPSLVTKIDILKNYKVAEQKIHVVSLSLLKNQPVLSQEKESFLLFIGTLGPRKNLPGLLRAFARVCKRGFPHQLILIGKDENQWPLLTRMIDELEIPNRVIYKGYVSEEEKIRLLQKATLLLMPSFYEGFGYPLLEAMSYGTPVVTSNISSMPEVVGNAGVLVDPNQPEEIATSIEKILSSPTYYQQLVENSLKQAQDFSLEKMINSILDVYQTMFNL